MARREFIISIVLLAIGIILLLSIPFNTTTRDPRPGYLINVNPRTFPYIMSVIMTVMGAFNVFIWVGRYKKSLSVSADEKKEEKLEVFNLKSVLPLYFMLFIYVVLITRLGYIISTVLICIASGLYFKARVWQALLLGLILSPFVYFLFTKIGVPLPRGILYFL